MKNIVNNQKGAILIIFALSLIVLVGFAALGTEVGRWYLTRAELSKAVDAAALAGAANISNPNIDVRILAQDFGMENFQPGYLGTPGTGDKSVSFQATTQEGGKLSVTGSTNSVALLARVFGIEYVATGSSGAAQKNNVEIMIVLDRSGSMAGTPIRDLKNAAKGFLAYYQDTQDEDRIGLVSFATGVTKRDPATNFFTPITNSINAMVATGATNAEDAIAQAGAALPDQTPFPPANRIQQYIVFFTDGHPTAFRSMIKRNGTDYDAVVCSTGNCDSNNDQMYSQMGYPNNENWYNSTLSHDPPYPTGDGKSTSTTVCKRSSQGYINIKWGSFSAYPVSGLGAEAYPAYCGMGVRQELPQIVVTNTTRLNGQNGYICKTARQMALDQAQTLKDRGIKIYAIGLGNVDTNFLWNPNPNPNQKSLASGKDFVYITPNSSELEAIFNKIAKDIKLRLVQ